MNHWCKACEILYEARSQRDVQVMCEALVNIYKNTTVRNFEFISNKFNAVGICSRGNIIHRNESVQSKSFNSWFSLAAPYRSSIVSISQILLLRMRGTCSSLGFEASSVSIYLESPDWELEYLNEIYSR
jgi:hypothetical protein